MITMQDSQPRSSAWVLGGVLMLVYLAVRVPGMGALPIYGDEATYLRWAQLVREGDWWVSLQDPKPPLHFWLIAACLKLSSDPVKVVRGLSVLAGMLTVPALMGLGSELDRLVREGAAGFARRDSRHNEALPPSGRVVGVVGALLMIFCPYLAFYQRLGTADAWMVLEGVVVLWLGLKLGARVMEGRRAWGVAVALGLVMGAAVMTRQVFPYVLPAVVLWGFVLSRKEEGRAKRAMRMVGWMVVAGMVTLGVWWPVFAAYPEGYHEGRQESGAVTRASVWEETRARLVFRAEWSEGTGSRVEKIGENALKVLVPTGKVGEGDYQTGWLWVYLTPGVVVMSAASAVWMGVRRQWRLLAFLLGWFGAMAGPIILFGTVVYARYLVPAALPVLVMAGYGAVDFLGWVRHKSDSVVIAWVAGLGMAAAALVLPMRELRMQSSEWRDQVMVGKGDSTGDRYQYITGQSAGLGVRQAARYIQTLAANGPVVVITGDEVGNPADGMWALLQREKNVTLYWVDWASDRPVLEPAGDGRYWLRENKWSGSPARPVKLPVDATVCYVCNHPMRVRKEAVPADILFTAMGNRHAGVLPFGQVHTRGGDGEQVLVFILGDSESLERLQGVGEE